MAVGCGAKFAKVMLIIFNILFLCSGLILIALGIWLLVLLNQSWGQVFELTGNLNLYKGSAGLLLALGCLIVFVTIFGLVAAIKESAVLLTIYAVLLFIIFGGEIAGGVIAMVYKDRIVLKIDTVLNASISLPYYNAGNPSCQATANGKLWDYVQLTFTCCGVESGQKNTNGYDSSNLNQCNITISKFQPKSVPVPLTCCLHDTIDITSFKSDNQSSIIDKFHCDQTDTTKLVPCTTSIKNWIIRYAPVLIGIGIGFAMIEMFGFLFVICLCMNTDKGFKRF